jgi:hypothetical protein
MHAGTNSERLAARVAALVAELTAYAGELPTAVDNSAPAVAEPHALSTREAARLLGVTPYTLNEWARLGKVRARQDATGGRRYFDPADIAAYTADHTSGGLPDPLAGAYSSADGTQRSTRAPAQARVDASGTCGGPSCDPQHGRPVGARRTPGKPARNARPYAPGSHAWRPPPEREG